MSCCHNGCAIAVVPGTSRCEKHTQHHRKDEARRRVLRRSEGKCGICDRDAVPGKARCEVHDSSLGAYRCGECREYGHNRRTCQAVTR